MKNNRIFILRTKGNTERAYERLRKDVPIYFETTAHRANYIMDYRDHYLCLNGQCARIAV